jgi:tRNA 2-thiouridine synthesizing protein E
MDLNVDGEGFLVDRDDWSEEVARELARRDDMEITDQIMEFINEARRMYDENGVVPPIRKFSKEMKVSTKDLYDIFQKGPMKLICKWGGLPKPTGCV